MSNLTVNAFRTRKAAHRLSRTDSGWPNPFALTYGKQKRAGTWNGEERDVERGSPDEATTTTPIFHASTAPDSYRRPSTSAEEADEEKSNVPASSSRDPVLREGESSRQEKENRDLSWQSSTPNPGSEGPNGMRNRGAPRGPKSAEHTAGSAEAEEPKKEHRMFKSVQPKEPFTFSNQIRRTIFNSWINVLILAAPVGIALNYVDGVSGTAVFIVNFAAIIPLAAMLSFATEEIALRTGETLGGLLNATFGNAVELIVAVIALAKNEVVIVQTSLIGSILSNLLLVMGMCFLFGGLRRQEQFFNMTVAQTAASLLALAVAGVIIPSVFDRNSCTPPADIAKLSRGTAVILLLVYAAYLYFQLKTHHAMFSEESQKVPARPRKSALKEGAVSQAFVSPAGILSGAHGGFAVAVERDKLRDMTTQNPKEDEDEEPQLSFGVAIAALTLSTVIIGLCAEYMVDGISSITKGEHGLSEEFVGLILLPIVGNAAEHATAVTVAMKDKMDLAIGVAVGSSMQVSLFLIPLLVILGWIMGKDDMTLSFDMFQVAILFVAVLLVNYLIADGKSHWLEGVLLMALYVIIAVCSIWYPQDYNPRQGCPEGQA